MRRWMLLALLGTGACAEETLWIRLTTSRSGPDPVTEPTASMWTVMNGAFIIMAVEPTLTFVDHDREVGVLHIELVDVPDGGSVGESENGQCRKRVRSSFDANLLAHAFGHVFGLEHHGTVTSENVMSPDGPGRGDEITDAQLDEVQEHIDAFVRCPGADL